VNFCGNFPLDAGIGRQDVFTTKSTKITKGDHGPAKLHEETPRRKDPEQTTISTLRKSANDPGLTRGPVCSLRLPFFVLFVIFVVKTCIHVASTA